MKKILLIVTLVLSGCGGGSTSTTEAPVATVAKAPEAISCIVPSSIAPAYYTGSYSIPTPTQQLETNIQRSVGLKDYYAGSACAYGVTLDRLQALGVDRVWVYNYGRWNDFSKDIWTIDKDEWQIPESSFTYLVTEAKKRNIKVFLALQFTAVDKKGVFLPFGENVPEATMIKILNSHHKLIVDYVKYGEKIGLAGVSLDWNAYYIHNINDYRELWATSMVAIAKDIRANFSGVLTYGQMGMPLNDSRIYDVIDEIHVSLVPRLTEIENSNISIALLKTKFTELIDSYYSLLSNTTKPVTWEIAIQSRDKYFTEGWVEDGFCIGSLNGVPMSNDSSNCMQKNYTTDFSIQAMGIQAAFEAIAEQNKFITKSINFHSSYWHTDTLGNNTEGFPYLSQSIRGKPAEKIVKQWFSRS